MLLDQIPVAKDPFWDAPIKVALATALICLVAPIKFQAPGDIPVTLQSLVVLLVPILLGPWKGSLAVIGYLLVGGFGLPVFAGGSSGWAKLIGDTGGFLLGFVPAAWVAGRMAQGPWGRRWLSIALILLVGHQLILLFGFGWLGFKQGFTDIPAKVSPLLPGMFLKIALGTLILILVNMLLRRLIRLKEA